MEHLIVTTKVELYKHLLDEGSDLKIEGEEIDELEIENVGS